jgi:hypothetical protein
VRIWANHSSNSVKAGVSAATKWAEDEPEKEAEAKAEEAKEEEPKAEK